MACYSEQSSVRGLAGADAMHQILQAHSDLLDLADNDGVTQYGVVCSVGPQ